MNLKNNRDERPLSPHLTIHSKVLTSLFSISHRITGIGLSLGTVFISLWIGLIAFGENYFFIFDYISSSILFKIILFIWSLAVSYHLFNGVRYLFWSFGLGMEINTVYSSGYLVLFISLLFTLTIWII